MLGQSGAPMARYCTTVNVPTTARYTFDYLSRFDNSPGWDLGVVEAAPLSRGPVGSGSRFRVVAQFIGGTMPLEHEIIEFDPPHRFVVQAINATMTSRDTIRVKPGSDGGATWRWAPRTRAAPSSPSRKVSSP